MTVLSHTVMANQRYGITSFVDLHHTYCGYEFNKMVRDMKLSSCSISPTRPNIRLENNLRNELQIALPYITAQSDH